MGNPYVIRVILIAARLKLIQRFFYKKHKSSPVIDKENNLIDTFLKH